ncbi:Y' element ATP-dependent helicase protein 1 copy 4 [Saccharomyces cerevisiae]|nr:Y' element ATP-dependent helicase protein 1 copy 4 [Saccharomyces cerevisiae]
MKVSDRRKFEKANFDEFESALNNKNDLVHCPSITLFESIPTEVRSFYEDEKSGLIKVVKFRTGAMDRKRSFEKIVVSVMVGKNVQKFLTFVEDEPDFQGGPIPSKYLIPKKINLMVYTLFQVHTLKFNRKDYDTLSLFYLNRGYYNELSFPCPGTLSRNSECQAERQLYDAINVRTSATTTESTNSSTNATTTASINVRTSATTTESTNSSTNATTTASINVRTSATTTASINVRTSATTTASINVRTSATTTASTNSSTNATTTASINASAKEDANKDGNAEDNRFHPVTDINKESYKRKGSQMVLLERKKLKAQFPNTSENMNVLQFLGFRSDEIKHLFLYGIDVYFCPEGVFTQYGLCKGCQKMFELCVCWAGQKVSYRRMAWEALAVERMLRNDEEYKEYLEDIEPYHGDPVGYLKYFSVKRGEIYSQIQRNYAWYLAITRRRETISVFGFDKRQAREPSFPHVWKADQRVLALGVTPSKVPHWTAFLSMLIGLFCNKTFRQKLEYLLEQISEVWLLPHWVDLANVEVLAADKHEGTAVHADGSGSQRGG